jgi:hypothetical protein
MFADAIEQLAAKDPPRRLHEVRLGWLSEGRCVQTLHVGSYDDEVEVLARMHHEFIPDNGLRMVGSTAGSTSATSARSRPRGCAPSSDSRSARRSPSNEMTNRGRQQQSARPVSGSAADRALPAPIYDHAADRSPLAGTTVVGCLI